jgi:transposase InsO family protein
MPWKEISTMSQKIEFIHLAQKEGANIRALCRSFQISPRTAYKWLSRYRKEGEEGLRDRSRKPHHSPTRSSVQTEEKVLRLREENPDWGGRKLHRLLKDEGFPDLPHPNTITDILRRKGKINPEESEKRHACQRFEKKYPNELWQMDFKGYFDTILQRCYPFTVLDDHSRFNLGLKACKDEKKETVKAHLTSLFRLYGLPYAILSDNGSPWVGKRPRLVYSELAIWLMRLGIKFIHGRPAHPQTQGKEERFHRTLKTELLSRHSFLDLTDCQQAFDLWRDRYNLYRPHEALDLDTPASHYQISSRPFPEVLPEMEYEVSAMVRKVQAEGILFFRGKSYRTSKGLRGQRVELRETQKEDCYDVIFCNQIIDTINLNNFLP